MADQGPYLAFGQEQKLTQRQTLAPQMFQQMRLIAMPLLELQTEIHNVLENNPVLEAENKLEVPISRLKTSKQEYIENAFAREETLQQHLLTQLGAQKNLNSKVIETAKLLVQNLNNKGFHILPPQEVAKDADGETLQKAVELVQMMDPQGTCTSGSRESLAVQASLRDDAPEHTEKIIAEHWDELEKGKYKAIASDLHITENQVLEILEFIKKLNPFPGNNFSAQPTEYIIPELRITQKGDSIEAYLNDQVIPALKISKTYEEMNSSPDTDAESKKYISRKIREAQEFISMLEARSATLLKAANALVEYQKEFFLKGPKYLKPLTQKEFAKIIDVSESTVSRIANFKYVQTDWGIFPLSYFFPSQGKSALENIREIIESHKDENLSDQQISDLLKEEGITIARRTVSKYRRQI